jgi:uncharacterized protein YkwD
MIAAIAAAVLAVFGVAALVLPALMSGDPKAATNNSGAAPQAPLFAASGSPSAAESASPTASPTRSVKPSATTAPSVAITGNTRFEQQVVALVNNERRRARCQPVRVDAKLQAAARAHSTDMATNNFVSHRATDGSSADDRMRQAGVDQPLSENVAKGGDPQGVMRSWLRDRGDRANILDCDARFIGVGVAIRGRTPYWTQDFSR